MKINISLKDMELSDQEIIRILRNRIFVTRSEHPVLEELDDGKKAFVYYPDYGSLMNIFHIITREPEDIKVIEALEVLETYLSNHRKPI